MAYDIRTRGRSCLPIPSDNALARMCPALPICAERTRGPGISRRFGRDQRVVAETITRVSRLTKTVVGGFPFGCLDFWSRRSSSFVNRVIDVISRQRPFRRELLTKKQRFRGGRGSVPAKCQRIVSESRCGAGKFFVRKQNR